MRYPLKTSKSRDRPIYSRKIPWIHVGFESPLPPSYENRAKGTKAGETVERLISQSLLLWRFGGICGNAKFDTTILRPTLFIVIGGNGACFALAYSLHARGRDAAH